MLKGLKELDLKLFRYFRTAGHTPERDLKVKFFSKLGEHAAIWLVIGMVGTLCSRKQRREWFSATFKVGLAYLNNIGIKLLVRRRRPQVPDLPPLVGTPTGLSFPSAHSCSSFAAAYLYAELLPKPPLFITACAMAYSRLYLGVHYPSDVLAGAALGAKVGKKWR